MFCIPIGTLIIRPWHPYAIGDEIGEEGSWAQLINDENGTGGRILSAPKPEPKAPGRALYCTSNTLPRSPCSTLLPTRSVISKTCLKSLKAQVTKGPQVRHKAESVSPKRTPSGRKGTWKPGAKGGKAAERSGAFTAANPQRAP